MIAYLVLVVAAFATAMLSGLIGMGGGILLLATLFCFLSHAEAIPTHAAVQIASNGTRVLAFLRNVDREAFLRFLMGVVPGGLIGAIVLYRLGELGDGEPYLKAVVGCYVLLATWMPVWRAGVTNVNHWWDFPLVGLAAGTAALTVGAVGPLIAPMFARRGFVKERLIAPKACCQLATHAMKIPAFLLLRDLDVERLGTLALVMIVMVIPGTLIGKRLLRGIAERHFEIAYRVALSAAGLKVLVVDGLYAAWVA